MKTINCKGKLISIDKPIIMGIINATDESFYTGYLKEGTEKMLQIAKEMLADGATLIDLGGQSTKPGAQKLTAEEEGAHIYPVIEKLVQEIPDIILSVDTFYASVAEEAVRLGACIINDISAGEMDKNMIPTVGKLQVPYCCMHMQGTPQSMQENPQYEHVVQEVLQFLIEKKESCSRAGINDFIADPGFGFGKTLLQNYSLLKHLSVFEVLDCPILVGLSRKSMIYKAIQATPDAALNGTSVLHGLALQNGANLLRVHDVKEAAEAIALYSLYQQAD